MKHVISLGAGVQSSTMALMAAHGEITPMPERAIFADTGWEPSEVYFWLKFLCGCDLREIAPGRMSAVTGEWRAGVLPFPLHVVQKGDIRHEQATHFVAGRNAGSRRFASLPYFTKADGKDIEGRLARQCTAEYKIEPIGLHIRHEVLGLAPRQRAPRVPVVTQWRGISLDEIYRMKPSREPWMIVRYPLAMEIRMTRNDCLNWMERKGYPKPPRSACIGCPFHNDQEWLRMKQERPDEFKDACQFDDSIRRAGGMRGNTYLHRLCIPLREVDLEGRVKSHTGDLPLHPMGNECEGMCGV